MTVLSSRQLRGAFTLKAVCVLIIGIVSVSQYELLKAADNSSFDVTPSLRIKEVTVPSNNSSQWPKGDWYPVPLKKYQLLKKAALLKKNTPKNSWIQEATYEATLSNDHLINGRLKYELYCSKKEPGFIDLSQLNLAVHELKWGDQDAVWGLAPNEKNLLLVDRFGTVLTGQWSLKGRQLPQRIEFSFQLPETVVSRVHLKVPRNMILTTSAGYVSGPTKSDLPNYDLWQIELGGQSRFQAVIHQQEQMKDMPVQVLYHQFAQIGIREDGLRLREDFQIEILNKPVNKLVFEAPTGFEIYSVTLGNDLALPFEIKKQNQQNQITVDLIDPLIGISRPLTVRALASPSSEEEILIPRLSLREAHFLGGTIHVDISAPLQTNKINFVDLRQTGVLIQEEQGEAYDFKQYSADARLSFQLALPDLNLSARVHSLIQVEDKVLALKSRIRWTSVAGSTYRLESIIPTGWEITQVSSILKNNSGELVWDVEQSQRQQKLSVRLPVAVSPESPYSLEIRARRLLPITNRTVNLYGINPLGCQNVDRILELSGILENVVRFDPDKEVEELLSSELPKNWEFLTINSSNSQFFHLPPYSGSKWGSLISSQGDQSLQVSASTYLSLTDEILQENYTVTCVPAPRGIQKVLIYLSEEGKPIKWLLPSESKILTKFKTQKLPTSEHQKWQLPNNGELWELEFTTLVFDEFEIRGERQRSFVKSIKPTLIFTPQANPFRGVIRVLNSSELNLRMKTDGIFQSSGSNSKAKIPQKQGVYEWEYEQPSGSLTLSRISDLPASSDNNSEQATAKISIDSYLGHGDGEPDVHQSTISLDLSKTDVDKFVFHFASDVKLISTAVDGRRVTPIETDNQYLIPLFDQLDSCQIKIQYQTLPPPDQLTVKRQIPFPQINQRVLETDWNFVLPEGDRLVSGPANMVLREALPDGTLTRRFFGILGQSQSEFENIQKQWSAVVLFPVEYGIVETSNSSKAKTLSWVVLLVTLLIGLLLRVFRVGIRNKLCVIVALIALMFSWILPIALAQIAGSCFTGLLIVMLIPRRFLRQKAKVQAADQSTKAYKAPVSTFYSTARLLIILILGMTATGNAQTISMLNILPSVSQPTNSRTELVLLPEHSDASTESYAYLTLDLLRELERISVDSSQPEFLLSSARYEGEIHDNQLLTVKATFQVSIPAQRSSATIHLPISGGNLGGPNSCLVDGKVSSALLSADEKTILIKVENKNNPEPKNTRTKQEPIEARKPVLPFAYQKHQIELLLHPAVKMQTSGGQFEVSIPRISKNQFIFQFNDSIQFVELADDTGVSKYHLAGKKQLSIFLKESSLLKAKWLTGQDSEDSSLNLEAAVLTSAKVSPSLVQMVVRVKYNVIDGKVDYLTWKLPAGTIVRSVKSPGIKVIPALNTKVADDFEELLLELSESKTGEFVIDAVFDLPARNPMSVVNIPVVDFSSEKQSSSGPAIKVVSHQLGIHTDPEFEVEQEGTLPDGVLSVSSKSSSKQTENSILKSSALLFQVDRPVPISLTLKPKNPERKARINQTVIINKKNIDWTFAAELRISQAPAFRHTIIVPPDLKIESLSVKEEDVERLAHWHRIGNKITLFLKNKTSGLQDLTLKGWLPLRKYGSLEIPSIQIEGTVVEESNLTLYRKNQIEVQFTSTDYRRLQDNSIQTGMSTDHILLVGRFQVVDFASQPISLVIKSQDSFIPVDSLTIVDSLENGKLEITQALHFLSNPAELKKLSLLIPAEYANEFSIDGMPYEIQDKLSDNMQRVELQSGGTGINGKTVTIRATIIKPINELVVLPVILEKSKIQNSYFLLSSSQGFQLFDPKMSQNVLPENVPDWVQARCNASANLDCGSLYVTSQLPWKLKAALRNTSDSNAEFIPFIETEIFLNDQGVINGLTHISLFNQSTRVLKLNWPENLNLVAVLVDGELNDNLDHVKQSLEIPISSGSYLSEITLLWNSEQIDHELFLEKVGLKTPTPSNFQLDKNLIKVISSDKNRIYLSESVSPFKYFADKLEEQLKIAELELELAGTTKISNLTWDAINKELKHLELIQGDSARNRQINRDELNQFRTLKERLIFLKQYTETDPSSETVSQEPAFVSQFQQKLETVPRQKVRYYSSSGSPDTSQNALDAWVIPNPYLEVLIAGICLLVLLPLTAKLIQCGTADWLNERPVIGLFVLGLIWILFLSPQIIGVVIILFSVLVAFRTNQAIPLSAKEPVSSPAGTQSEIES